MKTKKMFLLFAAFLFAAIAGYNIHLAQSNQNSDVSIADIAVMAQAQGESPGWGQLAPCFWHYSVHWLYNPLRIIICGTCCYEKAKTGTFHDECTFVGCDNT